MGLDVVVPVGAVEVKVLEVGGRWQDNVRVVGRVGQELLVYDREEVLPPESVKHARLVRTHGGRV